jgi:hypothetical protein
MEDTHSALQQVRETLRPHHASDLSRADPSVVSGEPSPLGVGSRFFEKGLKYGAVLRGRAAYEPFFRATRLAFDRWLAQGAPPPAADAYGKLQSRYRTSFAAFVSAEVLADRETPDDTSEFARAVASMQMTFTERLLPAARATPDGFPTEESSAHLIGALGVSIVARLWDVDQDRRVVAALPQVPVHPRLEGLKDSLCRILASSAPEAEIDGPAYEERYRAIIRPGTYRLGLVGGMRFAQAYTLSLVRERGRVMAALLNMFLPRMRRLSGMWPSPGVR